MSIRILNRSFSGGEITAELFGRLDLSKVQEALSLCMNFITLPHGPVVNRPGTEFVEEVKDSTKQTRLIPFTYSNTQTFAIQLGAGYFRFHSQAATLQAGTVAAWSGATAYKVGDLASAGGLNYYCILGNTNNAPPNPTYWYALPANGDYEIPNPYAAADLMDIHYTQSADVLTLVHPNYPPMELRRYGATNWQLVRVQFTSNLPVPLWSAYTPAPITHTYVVTVVYTSTDSNGVTVGPFECQPSAEFSVSADLNAPGSRNNLSWYFVFTATWLGQMVTGTRYHIHAFNVYKKIGGQYQYLAMSPWNGFVDDVAYTPNPGRTPPPSPLDSPILYPAAVNTAGSASVNAIATGTGPTVCDYVVTSVNGTGESLPSVHATCNNTLATAGNYNTISWCPVPGVTRYNIYRLSYGIYGFIGQASVTPSRSGAFTRSGTAMTCTLAAHGYTSGQAYAFTFSDPTFNGTYAVTVTDFNTFTLTVANAGATSGTATQPGGGANFVDNNITPDIGRNPPIVDDVCNTPGNFPAAVAYYQQRRVLAGSTNQPQNVWATRSGTEADMAYTIPTRDDNRIAFKIAARDASAIRHIVPLQELLFLSGSCEWKCSSTSGVLTPSTINVQPQSYIGANNVMPVVVGNAALYAAARGGHIRQINYNWQINGYQTTDSSIFAPHLFDYNTIVDMAYCRGPIPILWCVSSTGKLLGMTYLPEQQISAWHQHTTGAADVFESVCCITENNEDMLYCVVNRNINGTQHRFVERLHTRLYTTAADCHYVDCGMTFTNPATNIGTFARSGPSITCSIASHGLTNGQTYWFSFSDSTYGALPNGVSYPVTWVDANTFTVPLPVAPVSISIGSPAVVTWNGHGFATDAPVAFGTAGALPGGITAGTTYYVNSPTANTFQIAAAPGGSPIATSGTQSGTQSCYSAAGAASGTVTHLSHVISGLTWLNGMAVNILADGAVLPQQVVTGGSITLPTGATEVHVGLPLTAQLQTPPAAQAAADTAFAQGMPKNVNKVYLRTYRSSGILAGPDFAHLTPYRQRTTENPGAPPNLVTDEIEIVLNNSWGMSGQVCVQQSDPLPLDIASMTLEIALGGGV